MRCVSVIAIAAVMVASSLSAHASDMSDRPEAPRWTGPYIGIHAGYGRGENAWSEFTDPMWGSYFPGPDATYDIGGSFAGGQIGYNWHRDRVVIGIEADANWSSIDGAGAGSIEPTFPGGCLQENFCETEIDSFGTITGRLGILLDASHLLYAKGGVAWGRVKEATGYNTDPDPSLYWWAEPVETRWGWTVGGGLEYALGKSWSLRAEYDYIDLGNDSVKFDFAPPQTFSAQADADIAIHTFNVGINYRFGN